MDILWALLLVVGSVICWSLTLFGLPGNWLIVAVAAIYAYLQRPDSLVTFSWSVVGWLVVLATLGEVVEFVAAAMGVKKVGGSRRGAVLSLAGSIVGGIVGIFVGIPIPIVGS